MVSARPYDVAFRHISILIIVENFVHKLKCGNDIVRSCLTNRQHFSSYRCQVPRVFLIVQFLVSFSYLFWSYTCARKSRLNQSLFRKRVWFDRSVNAFEWFQSESSFRLIRVALFVFHLFCCFSLPNFGLFILSHCCCTFSASFFNFDLVFVFLANDWIRKHQNERSI